MTVLWILLGVLAAIILLLCLPLTLRLSWLPKPEQPAPCLLTDEVNKEIEALDLPQTDRQLLRQMVEQTKAPPVTENQLKVDVKVLLFTIHLFPFAQKKKVTPKKQQKQPQKKQEKASDSNEQKPKTSEILAMLPQLWQCAKKPLQMVLGDVCLHHLKLYGIVSREDTAQSALEAQKFSTLLYTLLGMVQNIGRVKRTDILGDRAGTLAATLFADRSPNRGSGSCCPLCSLLFKAAALPKGNGQAAAEGFHLLHNRRWKISSPNTGSKPIKSTQSKGRII